ncbi:MAG: DNA polymerase IV, partial [Nakamurella sp.]
MGASTGRRRVVTDDPSTVDDSKCPVLHADMDAFYATVELRRRPELRGIPMLVGSTRGRGVVLSATYEARAHGVRSAMPVSRAQGLCPGVVVVEPDMAAYSDASVEVMRLFRDVTPRVETLSVDEAFLDVGGLRRIAGRPGAVATRLRERMAGELGLSCTIGVAATKFMAKLASTLAKPDGLLIVPPERALQVLHPLGIEFLWGVGPKTADGLRRVGIQTIGELARLDRSTLSSLVGAGGAVKLHELAWARDPREVQERAPESSMSADATFETDLTDRAEMSRELLRLSERVGRRMRSSGQQSRCVSIRVRWEDFSTVSRSLTLPTATDVTRQIHQVAVELLTRLDPQRPVRLLSVKLDQLEHAGAAAGQLSFDDPPDTGWKDAEAAADAVVAKFGAG